MVTDAQIKLVAATATLRSIRGKCLALKALSRMSGVRYDERQMDEIIVLCDATLALLEESDVKTASQDRP
jgi:hypothetical protein